MTRDSVESVFQVLEGVIYYVDQTTSSNAMNVFVGSKEHVCIPLSEKHCSLQAFVKHVVELVGLGSRIDVKLCRLEKGPDGNKAYAIKSRRSGMKKDPCSVTKELVNYCKFSILEREKYA